MKKQFYSFLVASVWGLLGSPVWASFSYSNYTSTSGTIGGFSIFNNFIANSFTLTESSIITSVQALLWTEDGAEPYNVSWNIQNFSGIALLSNTHVNESIDGNDLFESSFTFNIPLHMLPGTYFLALGNATTTGDIPWVGWDFSNGQSEAYMYPIGNLKDYYIPGTNSESFKVNYEIPASVPIPSAILLLGSGLTCLGLFRRKLKN